MYPILFLSVSGLLMLFLGLGSKKLNLLPVQLICLFIALVLVAVDYGKPGFYFNSMVEITNNTLWVEFTLILVAFLVSAISSKQFDEDNAHPAEYYALMQLSLVGALLMVTFTNYIMLFVGLEILSVGLYVLTGSDKRNLRGNEAAIKYFLMGSFATGILLFGIAMLYGATGNFNLNSGMSQFSLLPEAKIFFYIGMLMISAGLLFKVSAVPFHFWTADVYQGAPSVFTAFMASIVKIAGIIAIYRIFSTGFALEYQIWSKYLAIIAVASIILGNITAVFQDNFKRMLAFSSISQAGFLLLSIIGLGSKTEGNLAFYGLSYGLATVSAFGVYLVVRTNVLENGRPSENINVFNGLFKKNSFLAVVLIISMLSLAGIPLTSGFLSKFFVLNDAAAKGYFYTLIIGVIMSAISLYYYFKPVRAVLSNVDVNQQAIVLPFWTQTGLIISTGLTLLLGLAPDLFRSLF